MLARADCWMAVMLAPTSRVADMVFSTNLRTSLWAPGVIQNGLFRPVQTHHQVEITCWRGNRQLSSHAVCFVCVMRMQIFGSHFSVLLLLNNHTLDFKIVGAHREVSGSPPNISPLIHHVLRIWIFYANVKLYTKIN